MHIGFDAKRIFLNNSGLGNYSRTLVQQLRRIDHSDSITLFTPRLLQNERTAPFFGTGYQRVVPPKSPKIMHGWWRTFKTSALAQYLKIDLFHGLSNELPEGLKSKGIKSILTVHDLIFMHFPGTYPLIDRVVYKQKMIRSCKQADAVVAISERTAHDLVNLLGIDPAKIHVIYQGCDEAFGQRHSREEQALVQSEYGLQKPYLISVGTIEERKNQLSLLAAYDKCKFRSDFDLVLVGKHTNYARRLKKFVVDRGLQSQVHFLTDVTYSDLPPLLQGARLMVYPSRYEGFGLPVLEAMKSGVAVLAGAGSCLEEVGGTAALYFEPSDIPGLTHLIEKVLEDEELNQRMITEGLQRAEAFDSRRMAMAYHELYKKVLAQ